MRIRLVVALVAVAAATACGSSNDKPKTSAPSAPATGGGHVTFIGEDHNLYRVEARANGRLDNISDRLTSLSRKGNDNWIVSSPDGQWLLVDTERFDKDCVGYACMAVVAGDLSSGETVRVNGTSGEVQHDQGAGAIASGGKTIVFPNEGQNGHGLDLYAETLVNGLWTPPVRLTGASPAKFNVDPVISSDGTRVLFLCGGQQYGGGADGSICEVHTDGSALRVVLTPAQRPTGLDGDWTFRSPAYEADGSIVFVRETGNSVWRLAPGAPEAVRVATTDDGDSQLCALPDGRLATSWAGSKEFKEYTLVVRVMTRSGTGEVLPAPRTKVTPAALSCSA